MNWHVEAAACEDTTLDLPVGAEKNHKQISNKDKLCSELVLNQTSPKERS
jgi:hypothetical protein